jgi:hypothetical protein
MKKLYFCIFSALVALAAHGQATICDPGGNVIIYSNYDGGPLTINVDQNIPNLKIGILSYEFATINITGTYASNVTEVRWVGFNGSNNHCNQQPPFVTTISGVPNPIDTMILYPAATYSNANGTSMMICAYSCNTTTNQGGCNTADQVAHYFLTVFGGSLYYHHTQYGCWGSTMNVSAGGNCCANPLTSIEETSLASFSLCPNPATNAVGLSMNSVSDARTISITNILGEMVREIQIAPGTTSQMISLEGFATGTYFFRMQSGENISSEKLVVTE